MCTSGFGVDREHRLKAKWITTLRRFTCTDRSGRITARKWLVGMDEASVYEEGIWMGGSGRYETLRGHRHLPERSGSGTHDSAGATIEAWKGVADFDDSPPLLAVSSLRVSKPRKPNATYVVRVTFVADDGPASSPVDFLVTANSRFLLAARDGTTTSGKASVGLRLRPGRGSRTIKLKVVASDRVGNYRTLVRTIELRRECRKAPEPGLFRSRPVSRILFVVTIPLCSNPVPRRAAYRRDLFALHRTGFG